MPLGIVLGFLCSAFLTGVGVALASGLIGHPIDGQLPGDWGWSLIMMGTASLIALGYIGWHPIRHLAR